jgi:hypothetical protein
MNFELKKNSRQIPADNFSSFPKVEFNSNENGLRFKINCLMAAFLPTKYPKPVTNLFNLLQSEEKEMSRVHLDLSYTKV